jgi:hypothetical protein
VMPGGKAAEDLAFRGQKEDRRRGGWASRRHGRGACDVGGGCVFPSSSPEHPRRHWPPLAPLDPAARPRKRRPFGALFGRGPADKQSQTASLDDRSPAVFPVTRAPTAGSVPYTPAAPLATATISARPATSPSPAVAAAGVPRRSTALMPSDAAPAPTRASLKAWWSQFTKGKNNPQARKPAYRTYAAERCSPRMPTPLQPRPHRPTPCSARPCARASNLPACRSRPQTSTASCMCGATFPSSLRNGPCQPMFSHHPTRFLTSPAAGCISRRTVCSGLSRLQTLLIFPIATEIEGTFRVNGSTKRMRDLQAVFETPPRASLTCSATAGCILTILTSTANLSTGKHNFSHPTTSPASSEDT